MKISRKTFIATIATGGMSLVLYSIMFFQNIYLSEFSDLIFLLFPARGFLVLSVVLGVGLLLFKIFPAKETAIKKLLISNCAIIICASILCVGYAKFTCYTHYTPRYLEKENRTETAEAYLNDLFPFYDASSEFADLNVQISHMPGTDYVELYSYGSSEAGCESNYYFEYFKSSSLLLNFKFGIEKGFYVYPGKAARMYNVGEIIKVDDVYAVVFVWNDNYSVLIKGLNYTVYAKLSNNESSDITIEEFVSEVVNKIDVVEHSVDTEAFLDKKN